MNEALILVGRRSDFPAKLTAAKPVTPRTPREVRETFEREKSGLWLASRVDLLTALAGVTVRPASNERLLLLRAPGAGDREFLHALFRFVVEPNDVRLLPTGELLDVLASPDRDDHFIGGAVAEDTGSVVLYRGNLEPVVIPKAWFAPRRKGSKPDFSDFEVIDFGQTIRFGEYEAAADAILYELDPDYRRRARQRRIKEDTSFGGSLRRLRLQKRISRTDFPGIGAKEIARIERGEVEEPHASTLAALARRLGVRSSEIESY